MAITYRKLDANGDPMYGRGQANFVSDIDAVAQAIATRLRLFTNEWWEDRSAGTPLFDSMLGTANGKRPEVVGLLLKQRILGTPYVRSVSAVQASFTSSSRAFSFSCQVQTDFGTLTVQS
jgi:hypothetical protein